MTTGTDLGPDADLAMTVARMAGDHVRDAFRGPLGGASGQVTARRNGPHDVVTPHDAATEQRISAALAAARPNDGFVGEETSGRAASSDGQRRTWIVDPIDGTVGFVSGLPFFSVSIALLVDDRIAAGVVHDPIHRETFVAEEGRGGWLFDDLDIRPPRPLGLRVLESAADGVICADHGDGDDPVATARVAALASRVRVVRTLGSTALSLAYLAAGRLDGVVQVRGLQAVDIAAGGLLAEAAGAVVTDARGGPWLDAADLAHGRGIAAAGDALHPILLGGGDGGRQPADSSAK